MDVKVQKRVVAASKRSNRSTAKPNVTVDVQETPEYEDSSDFVEVQGHRAGTAGTMGASKRITRSAASNNNNNNNCNASSPKSGKANQKVNHGGVGSSVNKEMPDIPAASTSKNQASNSRTRNGAGTGGRVSKKTREVDDDEVSDASPVNRSIRNKKGNSSKSLANKSVTAAAAATGKQQTPKKDTPTASKSTKKKPSGTTLRKSNSPPSTLQAIEDAVDRRKKMETMDVMSLLTIGEALGNPGRTTSFEETMDSSDSSEEENDWEEVEGMEDQALAGPSIPAEGVVVHLKGEGHNFNKKKGKKKFDLNDYLRKELNRKTREKQLYMHKASLVCLLGRGIIVNGWLGDEELQGMAFSLLPSKFSNAPKFVNLEYLSKFVAWFRIHFKVKVWDDSESQKNDNVDIVENLKEEMLTRNFSNYDSLVYIFIILLRSIKVDSRLMWSMQPLPLKPDTDELLQKPKELAEENSENEDEKDQPSTSKSQKGKKKSENKEDSSLGRRIISTDDDDSDFDETKKVKKGKTHKKKKPLPTEKTKLTCDTWVEVYLNEEERWVSVDLDTSKILCDSEIEKKATQPVLYVLSFDNKGKVKDLTRKYAKNWLTYTLKQRVDPEWWNSTLLPFMGKETQRDLEEDEFLDEHLLSQPIPKTLSECKSHPMFVHKRHFLQYEALYPPDAAPVGFIKSEPIYSRDNVKTLRKRELWMRDAKVVKIGETPYKIITRPKWDRATRQILPNQPLELFGEWQTEDYVPPEAKDGKVPRNEYGNVELFKDKMLPKGCVHLRLPQLNRVAKKLNIDCAPALTDFEYSRAGCHPVYDGYVVCEEFEDLLCDAWKEDQDQQKKKEEEKRIARIRGNWRRLYKAVLIHQRMKKKYPDAFKQESGPKRKLDVQQSSESGTKPKKRRK